MVEPRPLPAAPSFHASPLRGVLMVLLAALCWGTTGTAQSLGAASISAY